MATMAVMKLTTNPTPSTPKLPDSAEWFLSSSSALAASIVGTASMNENSTIVRFEMPMSEPPTIVAADRETPGTMAMA